MTRSRQQYLSKSKLIQKVGARRITQRINKIQYDLTSVTTLAQRVDKILGPEDDVGEEQTLYDKVMDIWGQIDQYMDAIKWAYDMVKVVGTAAEWFNTLGIMDDDIADSMRESWADKTRKPTLAEITSKQIKGLDMFKEVGQIGGAAADGIQMVGNVAGGIAGIANAIASLEGLSATFASLTGTIGATGVAAISAGISVLGALLSFLGLFVSGGSGGSSILDVDTENGLATIRNAIKGLKDRITALEGALGTGNTAASIAYVDKAIEGVEFLISNSNAVVADVKAIVQGSQVVGSPWEVGLAQQFLNLNNALKLPADQIEGGIDYYFELHHRELYGQSPSFPGLNQMVRGGTVGITIYPGIYSLESGFNSTLDSLTKKVDGYDDPLFFNLDGTPVHIDGLTDKVGRLVTNMNTLLGLQIGTTLTDIDTDITDLKGFKTLVEESVLSMLSTASHGYLINKIYVDLYGVGHIDADVDALVSWKGDAVANINTLWNEVFGTDTIPPLRSTFGNFVASITPDLQVARLEKDKVYAIRINVGTGQQATYTPTWISDDNIVSNVTYLQIANTDSKSQGLFNIVLDTTKVAYYDATKIRWVMSCTFSSNRTGGVANQPYFGLENDMQNPLAQQESTSLLRVFIEELWNDTTNGGTGSRNLSLDLIIKPLRLSYT